MNILQRLSTTLHDFCSLSRAERTRMLFVYIPMLLQAASCNRHGSGVDVTVVEWLISSAS